MNERRPRDKAEGGESLVGSEWMVDVGPVAHGGHCVARHEGQVLFVRHTLPGERVLARVTEGRVGDSFLRADAVSVETASPDRVEAPCRYAGPGLCGGCDFQHVSLSAQRALKAAVVREQFSRLADLDVEVQVHPVPGDEEGLRWRTRVEFAVDDLGRPGLRQHRLRAIVAIHDCLIATRGVIDSGVLDTDWPDLDGVDVIDAAHPDEPVLVPLPRPPGSDASGGLVGERVHVLGREPHREVEHDPHGQAEVEGSRDGVGDAGDLEYVVSARGFWQVHPGAATTFLGRVETLLEARPGDLVADLYAGAGLFTMRLGELVAPGGSVLGVEGDARAVANGIRNTEHLEGVEWRANRVEREVRSLVAQEVRADLVVLDPPRTGAGKDVVRLIARLQPRRIVYVACDPAALARDVRIARDSGYELRSLEAWDAFPMTHHVECIAVLEPSQL